MTNDSFTKFENELIEFFIGMSDQKEVSNILRLQFESAKNIERDFTGMGCFISFEIDQSKTFSFENIESCILEGPSIYSTELEEGAYSIFFFKKNGIFDCIEIVGNDGNFPEKELQNYIISKPELINIVESI